MEVFGFRELIYKTADALPPVVAPPSPGPVVTVAAPSSLLHLSQTVWLRRSRPGFHRSKNTTTT